MNQHQKVILAAGVVLIAGMGLFPPWKFVDPRRGSIDCGYGWIFAPPTDANTVDVTRLLIQWAVVATISGAAIALTKDQTSGH